jgi:amino acid adenylation domain-containing protein
MGNGIDERTAALSPARRELLALRLGKRKGYDPGIVRRKHRGPAPLSFAQQRLWLLDQFVPGNYAYNVPRALRLEGALDIAALERTLDAIVQRHEVLRTPFAWEDGSVVQVVLETAPRLELHRIDLTHLPAADREVELQRRLVEELRRPFDLSRDTMLRATLFRATLVSHVLLVVTHHIASDGWSKGVLFRELSALYDAFSSGAPSPLPELSIQYADFALWQRERLQGEILEEQLAYWRAHLGGAPPALELPTFRPRPPTQTYRGEKQYPVFPKALHDRLKALLKREGVTLFMLLMAAFKTLLYRYTGQGDVVVGTTVAGRTRPEIEGLIGFFMNTLALRTDLSDNPTFRELLEREREVALGAYDHQEIPFEKLLEELAPERDRSRSPLIQVMFLLDTPASPPKLRGLEVSSLEVDTGAAKYDLILALSEGPDELKGKIEYNTDLFDAATITRFLGHFEALLASIAEEPERRILDLGILRAEARKQLLEGFNQTRAPFPRDRCVHQLVEAQAARTPDAVAVVFEGREISYRELDRRSNQLAHYLKKQGVGPEVLVGIAVSRSVEMVVGLLGILKAGGAYVPIDPAYPRERVAFMIEDAKLSVLVTEAALVAGLPGHRAQLIRLDADALSIARESAEPPGSSADSKNLAYVIYTSGSTGRPKGVQIPHRAVVNFLTAMRERPGITDKDVLLAVTSLSFDIAGLEIFLPLSAGARLVLASREAASDGARLAELMERPGGSDARPCTFMQATPATWRLLLEAGWEGRPDFKVLCGGEALPRDLASRLLERSGSLSNMYGPTETTIWSTVYPITSKSDPILIGRPIANTELYILDTQREPVPIGVPGELLIGGDGLARGYLNRPELDAEKFIRNPFSEDPSALLYRTGDLCRYRPDGNVEFFGRLDHQVKIRGYRIELGEIEAVLGEHPAVKQAVVIVRDDKPGDPRLAAYVVLDPEKTASAGDLSAHLRATLPEIMVPAAFAMLSALPLTPNGKIDRHALAKRAPFAVSEAEASGSFVAPSGPIEETLARIWQEVLGLPRISAQGNFFELGGHSLRAMQVIGKVRSALDVELRMRSVFDAPTIAALAKIIAQAKGGPPSDEEMSRILAELDDLSEEEAARRLDSDMERDGGDVSR